MSKEIKKDAKVATPSVYPTFIENYQAPDNQARLRFTVTGITQSIADNTTTISWNFSIEGIPWVKLTGRYLNVNGVDLVPVNSTPIANWRAGQVINSGTTTFKNDNNGNLTLNVFIKQLFWYGYSDSRWNSGLAQSNSGLIKCSQLLRYPTIKVVSASTTVDSATINFANTIPINVEKYEIRTNNQSATLKASGNPNSINFSAKLGNLRTSTDYSSSLKIRGYANGGWGEYTVISSQYLKTKSLPVFGSTIKASIDGRFTITLSNRPNGIEYFKVLVLDTTNEKVLIKEIQSTETTIPFTFTEDEKLTLARTSYPDGGIQFYAMVLAHTEYNDWVLYTHSGNSEELVTVTIPDIPKYQPTFNSNNVIDVKELSYVGITGSNTKFIKNHNKLSLTIKPMTPKYNASGQDYLVTVGDKYANANYSSSNITLTMDNVKSSILTVVATDNRSLSSSVQKTLDLVEYDLPTIERVELARQNGTGTYAIITINGAFTNWKNLKVNNTIERVRIRWKPATGGNWSNYSEIPKNNYVINAEQSRWSINQFLIDNVFDIKQKYIFEVVVNDKLEQVSSEGHILSTAEVYIWKDLGNKRIGINKKPEHTLDVDGNIYSNGRNVLNIGISSSEPINGEDVWFKTTSNIFNLKNSVQSSAGITSSINNQLINIYGKPVREYADIYIEKKVTLEAGTYYFIRNKKINYRNEIFFGNTKVTINNNQDRQRFVIQNTETQTLTLTIGGLAVNTQLSIYDLGFMISKLDEEYSPYVSNNELLIKSSSQFEQVDLSSIAIGNDEKHEKVWFKTSRNLYPYWNNIQYSSANLPNEVEKITYEGYTNVLHFKKAIGWCKLIDKIKPDIKPYTPITIELLCKPLKSKIAVYFNSSTGYAKLNTLYKDLGNGWGIWCHTYYLQNDIIPYIHIDSSGECYIAQMQISVGDVRNDIEPYNDDKTIYINNYGQMIPFLGVETGENDYGKWFKFADGNMICTGRLYKDIACVFAWGSLYWGNYKEKILFPKQFIEPPVLQLNTMPRDTTGFIQGYPDLAQSYNDGFYGVSVIRPNPADNIRVVVNYVAYGRWK